MKEETPLLLALLIPEALDTEAEEFNVSLEVWWKGELFGLSEGELEVL